jgi:hypothetical protein
MTLQLPHSEFPYNREKFDFLFYQCGIELDPTQRELTILDPHRVNSQLFKGRNTTATFRTLHSPKTILVYAAAAARTPVEGCGGAAREDGFLLPALFANFETVTKKNKKRLLCMCLRIV